MLWTEEHDKMLIREIFLYEVWEYRHGSQERGQLWENIADSLNKLHNPHCQRRRKKKKKLKQWKLKNLDKLLLKHLGSHAKEKREISIMNLVVAVAKEEEQLVQKPLTTCVKRPSESSPFVRKS